MQHHFIWCFCSTISYGALKSYKIKPYHGKILETIWILIKSTSKSTKIGSKISLTIQLAICPPVFHDDFIPFISGG